MNHKLLLNKLRNIGHIPTATEWFENYLVDRTRCVHAEGFNYRCPTGLNLGTGFIFHIFMNDIGMNPHAKLHLYADDTVSYTHSSSMVQAVESFRVRFAHKIPC